MKKLFKNEYLNDFVYLMGYVHICTMIIVVIGNFVYNHVMEHIEWKKRYRAFGKRFEDNVEAKLGKEFRDDDYWKR